MQKDIEFHPSKLFIQNIQPFIHALRHAQQATGRNAPLSRQLLHSQYGRWLVTITAKATLTPSDVPETVVNTDTYRAGAYLARHLAEQAITSVEMQVNTDIGESLQIAIVRLGDWINPDTSIKNWRQALTECMN